MADSEQVKAALAALADGETAGSGNDGGESAANPRDVGPETEAADYRAVIERAVRATDDIEAAAEFVASGGLEELEAAVETAEHEVSGLAAEGRGALAAFERFRVAADGPVAE